MLIEYLLVATIFAIGVVLGLIMNISRSETVVPEQIKVVYLEKEELPEADVDPDLVEECKRINRENRENSSDESSSDEDQEETIEEALGIDNE